MDFKKYYQSLSSERQIEFASEASTSAHYIKTHLVYGRKIPKPKLFNNLVNACNKFNSGITRNDLFEFFYKQ